jgi:hypothetical protein
MTDIVTLTVRRPEQDITVVLRRNPDVMGAWVIEESLDEHGNPVHTTQREKNSLYERARAGEDETGR